MRMHLVVVVVVVVFCRRLRVCCCCCVLMDRNWERERQKKFVSMAFKWIFCWGGSFGWFFWFSLVVSCCYFVTCGKLRHLLSIILSFRLCMFRIRIERMSKSFEEPKSKFVNDSMSEWLSEKSEKERDRERDRQTCVIFGCVIANIVREREREKITWKWDSIIGGKRQQWFLWLNSESW